VKRLAIDTSTLACTVALQVGDTLIERHEEQPREHTRILMPMIRDVLTEADLALESLDAIVLGNGPGSFIGMRIAASVAQGLAFGANLKIIPVSSLAAVALQAFSETDATTVAVAQDAHMNEIYLGLYARDAQRQLRPLCAERLHKAGPIAELAGQAGCVAAGQGWLCYPQHLAANAAHIVGPPAVLYPRAPYLLALSGDAPKLEPGNVEPAYLRQKVAEKPRV
jgi:tRNA threonylcarbamoyladenosine biosynthesis protein TsaB